MDAWLFKALIISSFLWLCVVLGVRLITLSFTDPETDVYQWIAALVIVVLSVYLSRFTFKQWQQWWQYSIKQQRMSE
tara:strand:+ start:421 stop:651 length:231 start_codon:yes stop_codon:yes gene_type:complete